MDEFLEEVSREEWGALPPKSTEDIILPIAFMRFQHTGPDYTCTNKDDCIPLLRKMQKEHMEELNLPDIRYNFLIAPDGVVYECRGWKHDAYDPVKHYDVWKNHFINIAFIGNYPKKSPLPMKAERAGITMYLRMKEMDMLDEEVVPLWMNLINKDRTWI